MTKLCICQLCNCGRHRCKHRPNPGIYEKTGEDCKLTEYKTKYPAKQIPVRESYKPKVTAMRSDEPIEDRTTNKQDYVKHDVERHQARQIDPYRTPAGDFDFHSSYKKDFNEKQAPPAQAIRPKDNRQVPGRFEGESTSKADYQRWKPERQAAYGQQLAWKPPSAPFEGDTTVKRDFPTHRIDVRQSMKPAENNRRSDAPFDDKTGYRAEYIQHPLEPKSMREQAVYKTPTQPVESSTTNKMSYQGVRGVPSQSFKPPGKAVQSDQPLQGDTTFNTDYKKWPVQRVNQRQHDAYKKPEGDIDTNTTYKNTFVPQRCAPVVAVRPVSSNKRSGEPFQGATSYSMNYQPWKNAEKSFAKPRQEYVPMSAPFDGQSTNKAHFIPHAPVLQKSFKPDGAAYDSGAPFEDSTMYKMEYTKKKNDCCPALLLNTDRASYRYVGLTNGNHELYQPMTPMKGQRLAPLEVS